MKQTPVSNKNVKHINNLMHIHGLRTKSILVFSINSKTQMTFAS